MYICFAFDGQTLAFLVPLLARLVSLRATKKGDNKVLVVIAPSRELAVQIAAVCSRLLEGSDLRCQALIGGANINRQLENLKKKKPQVLVGLLVDSQSSRWQEVS